MVYHKFDFNIKPLPVILDIANPAQLVTIDFVLVALCVFVEKNVI